MIEKNLHRRGRKTVLFRRRLNPISELRWEINHDNSYKQKREKIKSNQTPPSLPKPLNEKKRVKEQPAFIEANMRPAVFFLFPLYFFFLLLFLENSGLNCLFESRVMIWSFPLLREMVLK